jgi:hypothetical protein
MTNAVHVYHALSHYEVFFFFVLSLFSTNVV